MDFKSRARAALPVCARTLVAGAIMTVAACASAPPPPAAALDAAQMSISTAERADAGRFAALELGEARQKLALANAAVGDRDMLLAARLADESRVSADLAYARTEAAKAVAMNRELERSAEALTEELQRAGDRR
jgi:hypothetical protein